MCPEQSVSYLSGSTQVLTGHMVYTLFRHSSFGSAETQNLHCGTMSLFHNGLHHRHRALNQRSVTGGLAQSGLMTLR